jgi:hypothetical protein
MGEPEGPSGIPTKALSVADMFVYLLLDDAGDDPVFMLSGRRYSETKIASALGWKAS